MVMAHFLRYEHGPMSQLGQNNPAIQLRRICPIFQNIAPPVFRTILYRATAWRPQQCICMQKCLHSVPTEPTQLVLAPPTRADANNQWFQIVIRLDYGPRYTRDTNHHPTVYRAS